ncbi:MAG: AAA family ATPase [Verrucomicrobiales bacterium]|nr:AAA family ATPase [Verrucomicrobiales bacterium]
MSVKLKRIVAVSLIIMAIVGGVALLFWPRLIISPEEISRGKFDRLVGEDAIARAEVTPRPFAGIYTISGTYFRGADRDKAEFTVTTHLTEAQLAALLSKPIATIEVPKSGTRAKFLDMVPAILVVLIVAAALAYQVNVGKGKSSHRIQERPKIRFADVAGVDEAKDEVQEVVDFLKSPGKYNRLGGTLPKGILLIGPPGTGKTMLAKAMAGEANAHFFNASGSDFTEVFVGVGAKRVREIFRQGRKHKPAIIFIDEIDCLGKNRKYDQNSETQQTLNALLTAMDGFESSEGVIVVGATNRPEDLDEALLRPGRFDRKVFVPLPDAKGRRAILASHSKRTRLAAADAALDVLAQTTPGMSGADLANVINEAAILGAQRNRTEITLTELEEARDKVRFGAERKSMVLNDQERRVVAYHEAGHAIIYLQTKLLPPLHKVSIIPRGQALGTTTVLPRHDQNIHSKNFLLEQLVVLMGGRAAEEAFCGDMTNGANGDLDSAKNIARKMIHDWGMGQKLYYEPEKQDAEREINGLLTEAHQQAVSVIGEQRENTRSLAEALLVQETLTRDEVLALFNSQTERTSELA